MALRCPVTQQTRLARVAWVSPAMRQRRASASRCLDEVVCSSKVSEMNVVLSAVELLVGIGGVHAVG